MNKTAEIQSTIKLMSFFYTIHYLNTRFDSELKCNCKICQGKTFEIIQTMNNTHQKEYMPYQK